MGSVRKIAMGLLLQTVVAMARAQETAPAARCDQPSVDCVAVGHWNLSVAIGGGIRTSPVARGSSIPLVVIPQVSYYGSRFFLHNLDVGVTLRESDANTFSLIASPGYDRALFYRSDLQNLFVGYPTVSAAAGTGTAAIVPITTPGAVPLTSRARRVTYLAGPEWTSRVHGFVAQVDVLHEVTGRNHGTEIRAALGVPLWSATASVRANLGATWKSSAIADYYFGVPGFYSPGSALNPFLKIAYSRPLKGRWHVDAFAHYEHLGRSIANSPVVSSNHVTTVFAGVVYDF